MRKRVLYTLIFSVMFLSPFLILSNHFINTVKNINTNYAIDLMDLNTKSISNDISDILINDYDVLKSIREKAHFDLKKEVEEITKKIFIKKVSVYNKNGRLLFSTDIKENKIIKDEIFDISKKSGMQFGRINYLSDMPPELIMGEFINDSFFLYVCDLGYINQKISKFSKKVYGDLYFIDSDHNIIFDSKYDYLFKDTDRIDTKISDIIKGIIQKGVFSYKGIVELDNRKQLIAISNIEGTKWWIVNIVELSRIIDFGYLSWARRVVLSGVILIIIFSYISVLIVERFYFKQKI